MMLEKTIEKKTTDKAKALGWWACKLTSPSFAGIPDRMFIRNGRVVFIEFKRQGEKPRKLQEIVIRDMRFHGAEVYVIDSVEAGFELFENILI
jgi:hypothetical protein